MLQCLLWRVSFVSVKYLPIALTIPLTTHPWYRGLRRVHAWGPGLTWSLVSGWLWCPLVHVVLTSLLATDKYC